MVKLATHKKVTLPNGRTSYAKWKRVFRNALTSNVKIKKKNEQKKRRNGQRGRGLGKILGVVSVSAKSR